MLERWYRKARVRVSLEIMPAPWRLVCVSPAGASRDVALKPNSRGNSHETNPHTRRNTPYSPSRSSGHIAPLAHSGKTDRQSCACTCSSGWGCAAAAGRRAGEGNMGGGEMGRRRRRESRGTRMRTRWRTTTRHRTSDSRIEKSVARRVRRGRDLWVDEERSGGGAEVAGRSRHRVGSRR